MKKYCYYYYKNNDVKILFSYENKRELCNSNIYYNLNYILNMCKNIHILKNSNDMLPYGFLLCFNDWMQFYKNYVYEFEAENDEDAINQIKILREIGEIK